MIDDRWIDGLVAPTPAITFEVAPRVRSGRQAAAVSVLHRLLTGDATALRDPQLGDALVLAAAVHRFAQCLLDDVGLPPDVGASSRYREPGIARQERVPATVLTWTGSVLQAARPLPQVRAFLHIISAPLVQAIVCWAPPVVLPADRRGRRVVVANHVPAILARYFLRAEEVGVGCVEHAPARPRALPAVCQGLVALLAPICACSWQSVAAGVHKASDAVLLTGRSRAQVFRIRMVARGSDT